jgi:hypothetical protein
MTTLPPMPALLRCACGSDRAVIPAHSGGRPFADKSLRCPDCQFTSRSSTDPRQRILHWNQDVLAELHHRAKRTEQESKR